MPLNDRLAEAGVDAADDFWPEYQTRWQRWNHIRTAIGAVGIALLAAGLAPGV